MMILRDVLDHLGQRKTVTLDYPESIDIEASGLLLLPGLIDPHVHFRVPGQEEKEDWVHAARAAIQGGYTQVFDMPNNIPPCVSQARLAAKKQLIQTQLKQAGVPLRYGLYFGADKHHFDQIHLVKDEIVGIKVFMGSSTGDLLMDDDSSLHAIFALAKANDLLVALHAEDEGLIQERAKDFQGDIRHCVHSKIRHPEVAARAVEKVIALSAQYDVRAYILHVSTQEELTLIRQAKKEGVKIYAETTPHHLFLNTGDYDRLQGRLQVNPPVRDIEHQQALFGAIAEGVIDTVGSDHAPHTKDEKDQDYGVTPSGMPGIETTLPLLLTAYQSGKIALDDVVRLTRSSAMAMFSLPENDDCVLVDMTTRRVVDEARLQTKCAWSPFVGRELIGWPIFVKAQGTWFKLPLGNN